jgi:hypothetical protein
MLSMHDFLKSSGRRLRAGWFWPLVLLALPNCVLQSGGFGPPPVYDGGSNPTSAIMCDIPKVLETDCATSTEIGLGMPTSHAAVGLVQGEQSSLVLDLAHPPAGCTDGVKKIEFNGPFPDGYAVCINCETQVGGGKLYADNNAACVAQCIDLVHYGGIGDPPEGAEAFCQANAHVATNFDPPDGCYHDACSAGGTLKADFVDPRRTQEPVIWQDLFAAIATGNDLTAISYGGAIFSGGASKQTITKGDGWVEFQAGESTSRHIVGFAADVDPDPDPSEFDIAFGVELASDGQVYTIENGTRNGPPPGTSLGAYAGGDRFRVELHDNNDGTASVRYFKLTAACAPGTICNGNQIGIGQHGNPTSYPLRVDASFGNTGLIPATLKNVTMVRIK